MKKVLALLLCAVMLWSFVSCVGTSYKTDVPVNDLADTTLQKLSGGVIFRSVGDNYFDDYFDLTDDMKDRTIRFAGDSSNLDEVGIFHVTPGTEKNAVSLLQGYLTARLERNEEFYNSYIPEEVGKLRNAEVKIFGSYVVYAILSDDNRTIFFSSVEEALMA